MSRLDLVIFGATGFTGKYTVIDMVRINEMYPELTWGVAGRSEKKLQELMVDVFKRTGKDMSHMKIIQADLKDEQSIKDMCSQAKVIVNCCGPYRLYGEPVVKAAIESRTSYVDVSGEPQFMETMQLKYDSLAREAGVYVVSSCGLDGVPNDMGVVYLQQNFGGTLHSVESYLTMWGGTEGGRTVVNYGTWESLIYSLAHYDELKPLRKKLYPEPLPQFEPKLKRRILHQVEVDGRSVWALPFLGADDSVVYRTQRVLYRADNIRPTQFKAYFTVGSLLHVAALVVMGALLFALSRWSWGRRALLAHPRLWSGGLVSRAGPSEAAQRDARFRVEMRGRGWAGPGPHARAPDTERTLTITGSNPGYGMTVTSLLFCAITILKERDDMPFTGGVLSPGAAFGRTSLVRTLSARAGNIHFQLQPAEELR